MLQLKVLLLLSAHVATVRAPSHPSLVALQVRLGAICLNGQPGAGLQAPFQLGRPTKRLRRPPYQSIRGVPISSCRMAQLSRRTLLWQLLQDNGSGPLREAPAAVTIRASGLQRVGA